MRALPLVMLLLIAGPARADDRRLASRSDNLYTSLAHADGGGLETRDMRISLGAPLVRGPGYGVAVFQRYATTWIASDRYLADPLTLHRFDLNLGGGLALAPGWSLSGGVSVSYGSDLDGDVAIGAAMNASGAVFVRRAASDNAAWTAGIALTTSSTVSPVIPMFGYVYQRAGSPFRFDMLLPQRVRASYRATPRLRTGLGLEARGDSWQVAGRDRSLELERGGGAVFGELGIAAYGPLHVELRLGASFDRYTLPDRMAQVDGMAEATVDVPLRASAYGLLQLVVVPN